MKPSIQKLHKFLKLEAGRGFDNGAVVGGLGSILQSWESEARAEGLDEALVLAVRQHLRAYQNLDAKSRKEVLSGLWRRVQSGSDQAETAPQASGPVAQGKIRVSQKHSQAAGKTEPPKKKPARPALALQPSAPKPQEEWEEKNRPEGALRGLAAPVSPTQMVALDAPLTVLPGVGEKTAKSLARLGLQTLRDALFYFPRRYDDYSEMKPINRLWFGEEVTIIGTVQNVSLRVAGRFKIVEALVNDGTGSIRATWFNQPWLVQKLANQAVVLSGKVGQYLGRLSLENPEWEPLERETLHTNRIVPVYPTTSEITQRWLRKTLYQVSGYWAQRVTDPLPEPVRQSAGLMPLGLALQQVHFPDSQKFLQQARHRLAFDEIFLLQLGVLRQRRLVKTRTACPFFTPETWLGEREEALPFALTGAQRRAVTDIIRDLARPEPMNRLLQGDVGSGKTVVAALAVEAVARTGAQAAIMAPTSILAEQHFKGLSRLLAGPGGAFQPEQLALLVGATPEAKKEETYQALEAGEIKLLVGTHALLEPKVNFKDLQLIIIDEQHRFGVQQRGALREKGPNAHLLVMTATPIPRSLALSVYGDMDISVIDEMPPGRQVIRTHLLSALERERAYRLVRREISAGRQAFMIFPLVEESEKTDSKAAVEERDRLQKDVFPDLRLALLHGRMKPDEKDLVMERFRAGEEHILVSTSVVEVGVDVPNATVIVIDGANRFGLAQLHQFRGRVGRGQHQSYCLLVSDKNDGQENERLKAMVEISDGFKLAEKDLEQRGPGEFLGTRQSGFSTLKMASLTDVMLIEKARKHAQELFQSDPLFEQPEHAALLNAVNQFWEAGKSDVS